MFCLRDNPSMPHFDSATLLMQGQRTYQEDAVVSCYPVGAEFGFTILSDGMGGHAGGDIASKICVSAVQETLLESTCNLPEFKGRTYSVLKRAVEKANAAIGTHISEMPEYQGMGATVIGAVNFDQHLYWASVGDSLLLLYRDQKIFRLNADHSMAAEIDAMVMQGKLSPCEAEDHPDRSVLTSALTGQRINKLDCTEDGLTLLPGDVLIVASDGLEYLSQQEIIEIINGFIDAPSQIIAHQFKSAIDHLAHDEQDNVSMSIVKVLA